MAMTHAELYEALKASIGERAASLIAEIFPAAKDLATKPYIDEKIAEVRGEMREGFAAVRGEMREGFAAVRGEIHAEGKHAMRWMLGLFIPVWATTLGTLMLALTKL
jgi:hypothetical protein